MIRDIDRHFLKTDQSIFVDIGVYENETAYNRVCVIGGYNQLVELEAHEPKGILPLYSVSYLSLKTHVQ